MSAIASARACPRVLSLAKAAKASVALKRRCGFDDGAGHGKEGFRCAFEDRRHHGVALSHPRPFVQEPPGRKQGLSVKGHKLKARCLRLRQRLIPQGEAIGPIQGHLFSQGHGEAPPPRARHGAKAQGPRLLRGIGRIVGGRHLRHCAQGFKVRRKNADAIEALTGRHHPLRTQEPPGGLKAIKAIESCRHTPGPGGVRP